MRKLYTYSGRIPSHLHTHSRHASIPHSAYRTPPFRLPPFRIYTELSIPDRNGMGTGRPPLSQARLCAVSRCQWHSTTTPLQATHSMHVCSFILNLRASLLVHTTSPDEHPPFTYTHSITITQRHDKTEQNKRALGQTPLFGSFDRTAQI